MCCFVLIYTNRQSWHSLDSEGRWKKSHFYEFIPRFSPSHSIHTHTGRHPYPIGVHTTGLSRTHLTHDSHKRKESQRQRTNKMSNTSTTLKQYEWTDFELLNETIGQTTDANMQSCCSHQRLFVCLIYPPLLLLFFLFAVFGFLSFCVSLISM